MTRIASKPRPYSRLETDAELLARLREKRQRVEHSLEMSLAGSVDALAEQHGLQRRIVWVAP